MDLVIDLPVTTRCREIINLKSAKFSAHGHISAIHQIYQIFRCYIFRPYGDYAIYYPVDISTTVFSYSRAMQYHAILHGTGVIAQVLLHRPWGYAVS